MTRWERFGKWLKRDLNARKAVILGMSILLVTTAVVTVWAVWFRTHKEDATIEKFNWHRQMEVIDYQPRHRGDWYDYPDDAYDVHEDYRYHYTTCISTGGKTPVTVCTQHYDYWYDYTVNRWEFQMWLTKSGNDQNPLWPPTENEGFDSTPVIGHRALSGVKKETYNVYFSQPGHTDLRHVSTKQSRWESVHAGQSVKLNINSAGQIRSVNWPRP